MHLQDNGFFVIFQDFVRFGRFGHISHASRASRRLVDSADLFVAPLSNYPLPTHDPDPFLGQPADF